MLKIAIPSAFLLLFLTAASPGLSDNASDESTLREIKLRLWPAAYREADPVLLETLLAPEFQSIGSDGEVSTRAREIDYVRGKPKDPATRQFRYDIERLETFENSTAILTGQGTITDTVSGEQTTFRYRSTNIFVKRKGGWLAVASHVTQLEPAQLVSE